MKIFRICQWIVLLTPAAPLIGHGISSLSSNDPYRLFSADNPYNMFLSRSQCVPEQRARFSVAAYRQSADKAGSCGEDEVPLGDIHGRWNMLGLFFPEANGNTLIRDSLINALNLQDPKAQTQDPCFDTLFAPNSGIQNNKTNPEQGLTNPHQFGFFSVPVEYRKYGARFEYALTTCWDIGLHLQTGVAHIEQRPRFIDKSCEAEARTCGANNDTVGDVDQECRKLAIESIMDQKETVAEFLGLNINEFSTTKMEDFILSVYWSRSFEINESYERKDNDWPHFTITPFLHGHASIPLDCQQDHLHLFSLPFGNDEHVGGGFTTGFTINFLESVHLAFDGSMMKYSSEIIPQLPVPTHEDQAGIYPRRARVKRDPGTTWTFGATLGAEHFVDRLSGWIEYKTIHHSQDDVRILEATKAAQEDDFEASNIKVDKLERESEWSSNMVNVGATYDISPDISLGLVWQAPVRQDTAYRTTTVLGSINATF